MGEPDIQQSTLHAKRWPPNTSFALPFHRTTIFRPQPKVLQAKLAFVLAHAACCSRLGMAQSNPAHASSTATKVQLPPAVLPTFPLRRVVLLLRSSCMVDQYLNSSALKPVTCLEEHNGCESELSGVYPSAPAFSLRRLKGQNAECFQLPRRRCMAASI
jgi:hypothetical protein